MTMIGHAKLDLSDRLLSDYQRDFPLVRHPFAEIARALSSTEENVLAGFRALRQSGAIGRIGGVVRPNTLGASTLAAMSVPDLKTGAMAELLAAETGVNHVYLRENVWNLWFVATGPDRSYVDETLQRLKTASGQDILELRLERSFHIDLGFPLTRAAHHRKTKRSDAARGIRYVPACHDRAIVQSITTGLPIVSHPFLVVANQLGLDEDAVIERIRTLVDIGIISRFGAIIRHRAFGWRSNAMVVWDVDPKSIDEKGRALSLQPGINLCYQRTRHDRVWPYNLYCMIHARTRSEAYGVLDEATTSAALERFPRQILFSSRCYKQTGALIEMPARVS